MEPVCGGIEEGESIRTAAIREVLEETGLTEYNDLVILPNEYSYYELKNGIEMHMKDSCILMIIDKIREIKLSHEHESYNWCYLNEVLTFNDWKPISESIALIESRFL